MCATTHIHAYMHIHNAPHTCAYTVHTHVHAPHTHTHVHAPHIYQTQVSNNNSNKKMAKGNDNLTTADQALTQMNTERTTDPQQMISAPPSLSPSSVSLSTQIFAFKMKENIQFVKNEPACLISLLFKAKIPCIQGGKVK